MVIEVTIIGGANSPPPPPAAQGNDGNSAAFSSFDPSLLLDRTFAEKNKKWLTDNMARAEREIKNFLESSQLERRQEYEDMRKKLEQFRLDIPRIQPVKEPVFLTHSCSAVSASCDPVVVSREAVWRGNIDTLRNPTIHGQEEINLLGQAEEKLAMALEFNFSQINEKFNQKDQEKLVEAMYLGYPLDTAFLISAARGYSRAVEKLLNHIDDMSLKTEALRLAVFFGQGNVVTELIDKGEVDVNARLDAGNPHPEGTPLREAIIRNRQDISKILFERGGQIVDVFHSFGEKKWQWAYETMDGIIKLEMLLRDCPDRLHQEAKTFLKFIDRQVESIWENPVKNYDLVRVELAKIFDHFAKHYNTEAMYYQYRTIHTLSDELEKVNILPGGLAAAAHRGDIPLMKKFLDRVPSVEARTKALNVASEQGHIRVAEMLLNEYGLDVNGRINGQANPGETPLYKAIKTNQAEMAKWLVAKGGMVVDVLYGVGTGTWKFATDTVKGLYELGNLAGEALANSPNNLKIVTSAIEREIAEAKANPDKKLNEVSQGLANLYTKLGHFPETDKLAKSLSDWLETTPLDAQVAQVTYAGLEIATFGVGTIGKKFPRVVKEIDDVSVSISKSNEITNLRDHATKISNEKITIDSKGNALIGDWSITKTLNAPENAALHWSKHMKKFPEYKNAGEYVSAAQNFVNNPPAGTLKKLRGNGDTVFYNTEANIFAVKSIDGSPRTMFKPEPSEHGYKTNLDYFNAQK